MNKAASNGDTAINDVVREMLSEAEKEGLPWFAGLFNPKIWTLAANEDTKCDTNERANHEGGG